MGAAGSVSRERVSARDDLAADAAVACRFRDDAVLERADWALTCADLRVAVAESRRQATRAA
jgi:hypothetical protein